MEPVNFSPTGIIQNILTLNYTPYTVIKEYLNNVLSKNEQRDYSVIFNLRNIRSTFGFEFVENNAIGFSNLEEMNKAFSIADSQRSGTNNMGYGIFSPITIHKAHDACNLFIQHTSNGRFYSITLFNSQSCSITTEQGVYSDNMIHDVDVSALEEVEGTRSIWFTIPEIEDIEEKTSTDLLKLIKKNYTKFCKEGNIDNDSLTTDIKDLGKYYYDYLTKGYKISYGNVPIEPIDILKSDNLSNTMKKKYFLSIVSDNSGTELRIKEHELDEWRTFTRTHHKPLGKVSTRKSYRCGGEQRAIIYIHDVDLPEDKRESGVRKLDKKIWVKVAGTYIFNEVFPLNGFPNIRAVLELTNSGNNSFDHYISPNANKSNSLINRDVKERICNLIKYTTTLFSGQGVRKNIPKAMREQVWLKTFGTCFNHECHISWCQNTIDVFNFHTGHNIPDSDGGDMTLDNLKPICSSCNTSMGSNHTIDSWNLIQP
jgi:hypothetical protein